ncbi:MAG: metalloregulator ArsR/SmtB family transcription factor [Chloroflexota bacterium]
MATAYKDSLTEEQFDKLLRFFQVFGNESRLKIIGHLANGDRSVGELADLLDLKEPTISHHLSEMKALGLVTVQPQGTMRIYHLDSKALERMGKDIFAQPNLAALVDTRDMSEDERILHTWVKDGRIVDIPVQEKKKQVIVRWVADQIDPDRRWTEKEFSEWLSQFNEDYAFLRRYLVDSGYMARDKGVYWRVIED